MAKTNGSNGKHEVVPFEVHNARFGGFLDPIATNALRRQLTNNLDRSWSRTWGDQLQDPRRSIEDECGYPALTSVISIDLYQQLYERDPIAARVVEVLPKQTWQVNPQVYEDESSEVNTPFEQDWDDLGNELRGGEMNWFQDEEGSPIWTYMKRLDVLSGIGSYGVMLLGFDDVNNDWKLTNPVKMLKEEGSIPAPNRQEMAVNYEKALKDRTFRPYRLTRNAEVEGVVGGEDDDIEDKSASQFGRKNPANETKKRVRLTHIRVFGEPLVQATQFESNPTSPRFGQPVMYNITLNDMRDQHGGVGMSASTYQVHWTRVIHYCDQDHQVSSSEIFAPPRMRASLNTLLGLRKIYHGDPEGYWKACVTLLSYETHPQLGGDVDVDINSIRDMDEQMMNGLQRSVILSGMSLKPVAPQVADPTPHINVGIEAVCIKIPCPIRVFKGSERGELASSQDDSQWNDTVQGRMKNTATPGIVVPFINRLIAVGTLSRPNVGKKPKFQPKPPADPPAPAGGGFGGPPKAGGGGFGGKPKSPFAANAFGDSEDTEEQQYPNAPKPQGKQLPGKPPMEKPRGGYSVDWPDLNSLSDQEKATIGATKTTGLAAYIAGGCSAMVPEHDYLTKYQGFTDEEADAMLEEAAALQEEKMVEQQEQAEELGLEAEPPPGMVDPKQKELDHEVELEKAKNGGGGFPFGGKGGSGSKPPFPPKKPTFNSENIRTIVLNWCNQYGGDTCIDGSKGSKAQEAKKGGRIKDAKATKEKVKESVKKTPLTPTTSKAKVKFDEGDQKKVNEIFGKETDIASVLGARDTSRVDVEVNDGADMVSVGIYDKKYEAERYIGKDADGNAFIRNESISVKPEFQGEGIGSAIFSDQVANASASGFKYIETNAAAGTDKSGRPLNGYYTWARMGYDQQVSDFKPAMQEKIANAFPKAKSVQDIMKTAKGRDWWKANGDSMTKARFDLSKGSRSMKVLEAYKRERAKR